MGIVNLSMYSYLYNVISFFIVECSLTLLTMTSSLLPTLRKPKGSQERAIQQQHLQRPTSITTVNVAYVPSFLWDVFIICALYLNAVHVCYPYALEENICISVHFNMYCLSLCLSDKKSWRNVRERDQTRLTKVLLLRCSVFQFLEQLGRLGQQTPFGLKLGRRVWFPAGKIERRRVAFVLLLLMKLR